MTSDKLGRPSIGFVVEGMGEQASYPSLISHLLAIRGLHFPIEVADGFGGVVANLQEHLDDLVKLHHPLSIVITVDLADVLRKWPGKTCADVRLLLEDSIAHWRATRHLMPAMQPHPESVVVVLQIQTFESWWLADPEGLNRIGIFQLDLEACIWNNVDDEVGNPSKLLKGCCAPGVALKSPSLAKRVIAGLNPKEMKLRSRSFRKFAKEVEEAYARWIACS